MAPGAIVDAAAEISFFFDGAITDGAAIFVVFVAHNSLVIAGVAEDIFFGVAAVLFDHLFDGVDGGSVKLFDLSFAKVFDFSFGIDFGVK